MKRTIATVYVATIAAAILYAMSDAMLVFWDDPAGSSPMHLFGGAVWALFSVVFATGLIEFTLWAFATVVGK